MEDTLINHGFPNYIVDEQIKVHKKKISQQNKHNNISLNKQVFIKHFDRKQMRNNY